jgi:hypothetical protein
MFNILHKIATSLIITLGLVHIGFTYHDYDRFTIGAVWFIGTGVALILAGFLNVTLRRDVSKDRLVQWLCHSTNIIFTLGFAGAILMLPQPQVFIGLLLFASATVSGFLRSYKWNSTK